MNDWQENLVGLATLSVSVGHRGNVVHTRRARRRMFKREAAILRREFERDHGPMEYPDTFEATDALCRENPAFAKLVKGMKQLQYKYF